MNKIRQYMQAVKVRNSDNEKKKQQVISCIDARMIEFRFIRQLQVLRVLRKTIGEVQKCSKQCSSHKPQRSFEHFLEEPNSNA